MCYLSNILLEHPWRIWFYWVKSFTPSWDSLPISQQNTKMDGPHDKVSKSTLNILFSLNRLNLFSIQKNLSGVSEDWIKSWATQMDISNAWLLNHVGWEEHQNLARSFKKLNPDIFNKRNYSVVSSFKVLYKLMVYFIRFR